MKSVSVEVGIDVSKEHLDVVIPGSKCFRVANTEAGLESLRNRLSPGSVVHLESSGGYERLAQRWLKQRGFSVRTHCPIKVRRMAQAKGLHSKTDALDAKHLADVGRELTPQEPKSTQREGLCDLSRTISSLKDAIADFKKRAGTPELDVEARNVIEETIRFIETQVQSLEKRFAERVKETELAQRYVLALSVPGVGPCLARTAVCELPENLDRFTPAQLTSYAGVAPRDCQSGKRKPVARVGFGNSKLKTALYMPAMSCVKTQLWARELYHRLKAKGQHHLQAAVAVMRRLLLRLIAVLKRGSAWKAEPISP